MAANSTTLLRPDVAVRVEVSGEIPTWRTAATFREAWLLQLTMAGLRTQTLQVTTKGALEQISDLEFGSREYRAVAVVAPLAAMKASDLLALVMSAAEKGGSYTATASIPAAGQASQPELDLRGGALGDLLGGLARGIGMAAEQVGGTPNKLFSSVNLIVIGLVVIVGFVAFGPNTGSIARAVRP